MNVIENTSQEETLAEKLELGFYWVKSGISQDWEIGEGKWDRLEKRMVWRLMGGEEPIPYDGYIRVIGPRLIPPPTPVSHLPQADPDAPAPTESSASPSPESTGGQA